ncbi:MAG: DNA gyrase C-terminal beta-propeller domain-containing protein [Nitriliruptoraceae bacterium]
MEVCCGGYAKPLARRRTTPVHKHGHDPLVAVLRCTTDDTLLLVETSGLGHRVGVGDLPIAKPSHRGTHLGGVLGGGPDDPLAGAIVLPRDPTGWTVVTASAGGRIKRTPAAEFTDARQRSLQAAGVKDGDRVVAVALCREEDHLLLAHDHGLVTRFPADHVRAMGRSAAGVAGMQVPPDAAVVALSVVPGGGDDGEVVTIGADGTGKRTPLAEYPVKGRGGKGLVTGTEQLWWIGPAADLHLGGDEPQVLRGGDLGQARRAGRAEGLPGPAGAPVVAEQHQIPSG